MLNRCHIITLRINYKYTFPQQYNTTIKSMGYTRAGSIEFLFNCIYMMQLQNNSHFKVKECNISLKSPTSRLFYKQVLGNSGKEVLPFNTKTW